MSGLNTREKERSAGWTVYFAAMLSLPADLMDTLFVNHHYESIHWSWALALLLATAAFYLLGCVATTARPLQRVAVSLFLCVCVSNAMLSHFGVQTQDAQMIGKLVVFLWWTALLVLIGDWIAAKAVKSSGKVRPPAREIPPDPRAEKARSFMLERLSREAADERLALSDLELQFLDYSRIASEESAIALEEQFFRTHDYGDFKKLIRILTRNAVKRDRETDSKVQKQYYRLVRDLKRGKHDQQLALFIERGILDARSGAEELRDYALYILIAVSVVAIPIAVALWKL